MGKKVLIVEDEFVIANDLSIVLEAAGYQVTAIADTVKKALASVVKELPDVVLVDIYLKEAMTGIDLAYQLRQQHIPFVYLSANSNQSILEQAKATEPYGFLVKPFREKDVIVALEIAAYRHEHSFESRARKKDELRINLTTIDWHLRIEDKLDRLSRIFQLYLPFDFITFIRKNREEQIALFCLLRTSFDEYQLIGREQLSVITALNLTTIDELIISSSKTNRSDKYVDASFTDVVKKDALKNLFVKTFQLQSSFIIELPDERFLYSNITLYSRKPYGYTEEHEALVKGLEPALSTIFNAELSGYVSETKTTTDNTKSGFNDIIGKSHLLLRVLDLVTQVAPQTTSVLITGESGTGKERIADYIHELSPRRNKPFIKINCASLPAGLIESELFGHEKGAFTGAHENKKGKFELAAGGTIFLDEIGEIPIELQAKLLRVLQDKQVERIGGQLPIKTDVRIIAATNRNLEKEVAESRFRLDLYFRLNVFPIKLPALRERKEDIPLLVTHITEKLCRQMNKTVPAIDPLMMQELAAYHWPGNIRELENVLEQSVIINDGARSLTLNNDLNINISISDTDELQHSKLPGDKTLSAIRKLQQAGERNYIISILKQTRGRIRGTGGAAELLHMKPTTLESRMLKLGIRKDEI